MTFNEIEELFIAAAHTDRRLPSNGERPAPLKAQAIPYFHTDLDVKGWGAERYAEERADFLSSRTTRLKTEDVSRWQLCNELMTLVPHERHRRSLWAWAAAEAGTLRGTPKGETEDRRMSFSRWCRDVERVHRNTGARRKDAAVSCIEAIFLRNTLEDIRKLQKDMLQEVPKMGHNYINIAEPRHWNDGDVLAQKEAIRAEKFDWVQWRNEQRRDRDRKRQMAA